MALWWASLLSRLVFRLVLSYVEIFAGLATIAVAFIAGVQIWREYRADSQRRLDARAEARALAWLARRTLESSFREAGPGTTKTPWATNATSARRLDPVQDQLIQTLRLGAIAGGETEAAAAAAFEHFLNFTDRAFAIIGSPGGFASVASTELANQAVDELRRCIVQLERIAPRTQLEADLPEAYTFPGPD